MVDDVRDVIVVGGGITGLTTAWYLHHAGVEVTLLEAEEDVGGVTRTEARDGFLLEKGPFNVIVRDPDFQTLLEGVSDEVQVVTASKSARFLSSGSSRMRARSSRKTSSSGSSTSITSSGARARYCPLRMSST